MRRAALALTVVAAALGLTSHAGATTFYVSPSGADSNAGTSTAAPWRTVGAVDRARLAPGDTVLFQAGATFEDAALMPRGSGTAAAPITFSSYGAGDATLTRGIWFAGAHNLAFDGLTVNGHDAPRVAGLQGSATGGGSTSIAIRECTFVHVTIGVMISNPGDASWTIENDTIEKTGDSGIISLGHDLRIAHDTILDTGLDTSIAYGKHGIYAKGANTTIVGNTIRNFSANGVSLRYHDDTVVGNTISGGPIGVAWFQNDPVAGTTTIAYNRISDTTASGIYVSAADSAGPTRESFVIAHNTISIASGNAMDIEHTRGTVTVANNVFEAARPAADATAYRRGRMG